MTVTQASGVPYHSGDVFVGVGTGLIKHFDPSGTLLDTLDTGTGCAEDLGMAFDQAGNLFATASFGSCGSGRVVEFDNKGTLIGSFGSGYSYSTESVVLDAAQHVFVGQPDGSGQLLEFTHAGAPVATFGPATENRGTDWNDLATDQCTMFYTSEGTHIKRFDVCKNLQLTDFATLPKGAAFALRIRPNGEVLVAALSAVFRLDSAGNLLQTYPLPPNEAFLFALNLDPNGSSFWTAGYYTGNMYKINIVTGVIETQFKAGNVGCCASGLAVAGEITVARGAGRIYLPAIPVTYHAP